MGTTEDALWIPESPFTATVFLECLKVICGLRGEYSDLVTRQRGKGEAAARPFAILRWAVVTSPGHRAKKQRAPALARSTLGRHAAPRLSTTVPLPFRGDQMWLHGCTPLLSPPPGSSPPHAGAENARLSSRKAQDFAPLKCN